MERNVSGKVAVLLICLVLTGCNCLPAPTSDSSPPGAGLTVEFRSPGARTRQTTQVTATDADQSIVADKNDVIAVMYKVGDPEGLRSVKLDYDIRLYSNPGVSRGGLLRAIGVESGFCCSAVL